MLSRCRVLVPGAWLALVLALTPGPAPAQGKLESFERDATAEDGHPSDPPSSSHHHGHSGGDGFLDWFLGDCCDAFFDATLVSGGVCSWRRVASDDGYDPPPRLRGEPLIPMVRLDAAWRDVESDVRAWDLRGEVGYGPIGLQVDYSRYHEDSPSNSLGLLRTMGLYRMSFGAQAEVDLGIGALQIRGDDTTTRGAFSFGVRVHPSEDWGIEYRPAWAEGVTDHDLALLLHRGSTSLEVGYRWVDSPHESLDGPYVGISIRW